MSPSRSHTNGPGAGAGAGQLVRLVEPLQPAPALRRPAAAAEVGVDETAPSGRPSSLAARQKWAASPLVPLPPPPRSASPSALPSPL